MPRKDFEAIRKETKSLKKQLSQIEAERAKIREMASKISAGIPTTTGGVSTKDLLEQLKLLTAYREQMALRKRIAQVEAEIEAESRQLQEEIDKAEQQLAEPLSLTLTAPAGGQTVTRGAALEIKWQSTGPVGTRLRIGLLRSGVRTREISYGTPTDTGSYSWPVPANYPFGKCQVAINDPTTGLSAVSEEFEIR